MRKRTQHTIIEGKEYKYCSKCDKWLPVENFNIKRASWDGLEVNCKECTKIKSAEFREENPEYDSKYQQKHVEELKKYKQEYYLKKKQSN